MSKREEIVQGTNLLHLLIIETFKKVKSLNKELRSLNLRFIMLLNKNPQLRVLKCL
jgi:hypothetical protein